MQQGWEIESPKSGCGAHFMYMNGKVGGMEGLFRKSLVAQMWPWFDSAKVWNHSFEMVLIEWLSTSGCNGTLQFASVLHWCFYQLNLIVCELHVACGCGFSCHVAWDMRKTRFHRKNQSKVFRIIILPPLWKNQYSLLRYLQCLSLYFLCPLSFTIRDPPALPRKSSWLTNGLRWRCNL